MAMLKTEADSGLLVVTLVDASGMDNPNSEAFRTALLEVLKASPEERIALDMAVLDTLSSSGIVGLLMLKRTLEARGGGLVIFGLQTQVHQVFKTLGLADFFTIMPDRAAALAELRPQSS